MDRLSINRNSEAVLNEKIEKDRMNEFLTKDVRMAQELKDQDEYTRLKNLSDTVSDYTSIDRLVSHIKTGTLKVGDMDTAIAKLEAVQGRNLSHLMLNDYKVTGDRREMRNVKEKLANLEQVLTRRKNVPLTEDDALNMEMLYDSAMEACRDYIDNKKPWFSTGIRRKKKVMATLDRLMKEKDALRVGREYIAEGGNEMKDIKSGVELLSFAAVKNFTRENKYRQELDKDQEADEEIADLKAQMELQRELVDVLEDNEVYVEFNKVFQEKLKQYTGFWGKIQMAGDKEYQAAVEKKNAYEKQVQLNEKKAEIRAFSEKIRKLEADKWNRNKERENKEKTEKEASREKRQVKLQDKNNAFGHLPEGLKPIASILSKGAAPSSLFVGKAKLDTADTKLVSDFIRLRDALKDMGLGKDKAKTVRIGKQFVCFYQDRYGNINIESGTGSFPVQFGARQIVDLISDDIINHEDIYGRQALIDVMDDQKTDLKEMDSSDLLHTRQYATTILADRCKVSKSRLSNLSVKQLKEWASRVLEAKTINKTFLDAFNKYLDTANETQKDQKINTVVNRELLILKTTLDDNVVIKKEEKKEATGNKWDKDEEKVQNFVSDLIYSKDTWVSDSVQMSPKERIKKLLVEHKSAVSLIISDEFKKKDKNSAGILEKMLDKLPLFVMEGGEIAAIKTALSGALSEMKDMIVEGMHAKFGKEDAEEKIKHLDNAGTVEALFDVMLKELGDEQLDKLVEIDASIDDAVKTAMEKVQDSFDVCVDELFSTDEKEEVVDKQKEVEGINKQRDENARIQEERNKAEVDRLTERYKELENGLSEKTKILAVNEKDLLTAREDLRKLKAKQRSKNKPENIEISIYNQENYVKAAKERYDAAKQDADAEQKNVMTLKNELDAAGKRYRMGILQRRVDTRNEVISYYKGIIAENKRVVDKIKKKPFDARTQLERHVFNEDSKAIEDAEKKLKKFTDESGKELSKIIEDSTKGKQGQGLFIKNVMKSYFKSMPLIDQRSMIASAIRNCKPVEKEKMGDIDRLSEAQKIDMMSDLLGGMFKGAGPLFQKMLQGIPTQGLANGLRKAIEDTQDNLAHIPEEVVRAQMNGIISRSDGRITKIEVERSLGAASVGQAFLCKVYGPDNENGKDMVVKLLRPDVRNRMMREKKVMLDAARKTDEYGKNESEIKLMHQDGKVGGMEATYMGNLQRIEEELDLTIEASNCEKGKVYDNKIKGRDENLCTSMKVSDLVEPTSDTCMMEIAGKTTVKRYISELEEKARELVKPFANTKKDGDEKVPEKNDDGSYVIQGGGYSYEERVKIKETIKELEEIIKEGDKKRLALGELAEKWVSEGVFEKGYYHGDLHAGNIMVNDNGVSVIDFGNATTLNEEQQRHISRMMVAATTGDVEMFRNGFHSLLENTPEEVYQSKRDELTLVFNDVLTMGDRTKPAERIAVALIKAQELGLELPPTIANFSSCQIRLQNTLNNMNKTMKELKNYVAELKQVPLYSQYQLTQDPLASFIEGHKNATKATINANAEKELFKMEQVSKEDFIKALSDRSNRDEFVRQYGFTVHLEENQIAKEIEDINKMLSRQRPLTKKDWDYYTEQEYINYYPGLSQMRDDPALDEDKAAFLSEIFATIESYVFNYNFEKIDPSMENADFSSFESIAEEVRKRKPRFANVTITDEHKETDTEAAIRDYYLAQDNKNTSKEELEEKANRVFENYQKNEALEHQKKIDKNKDEMKETLRGLLPKMDPKSKSTVEGQLGAFKFYYEVFASTIDTCSTNKVNGEEIRKEGDEFLALYRKSIASEQAVNENSAALQEALEKLLDKIWDARIVKYKEFKEQDHGNQSKKSAEQADFLDIMSTVLERYTSKVIKNLGFFGSLKAKKAMEA